MLIILPHFATILKLIFWNLASLLSYYLVIILSGNFTQRGEIAITNKYTRASWAIKAGADAVIELPTVFATATAELFASGAIKLINSISGEKSICFGVENNDLSALTNLANISLNETPKMQEIINNVPRET